MASWTVPLQLEAGKEYAFKFETGEFRARRVPLAGLLEKSGTPPAREACAAARTREDKERRSPRGNLWLISGPGKTIAARAEEDRRRRADRTEIPLMIKAGSIVPMGPFVQYSTEKPADPIELRIYRGADGSFARYEGNQNDNYDYEKGAYATIAFHWNDAKDLLTYRSSQRPVPGHARKTDLPDHARPARTTVPAWKSRNTPTG